MKITIKDWQTQGSFSDLVANKKLPIEVDEQIFYDMLECLPPQEDGKTRHDFISVSLPIQWYFLVGEPYTHINGQPVYATFARAYVTKYFFLGYYPESKSLLEHIEDGNEAAQTDWMARAESGEIMRII